MIAVYTVGIFMCHPHAGPGHGGQGEVHVAFAFKGDVYKRQVLVDIYNPLRFRRRGLLNDKGFFVMTQVERIAAEEIVDCL